MNEKYKHFVSFLRRNYITKKCDAVKILREAYDKTLLADCKLLACAIDNIVYDALHGE